VPPKGPKPRTRDINRAIGGLVYARHLTGVDFEFQPSIGLIAARIDKLALDIRSFREPLTRAVKEVMIPSFRRNFEEEGRPGWAELAPYTVSRRGTNHPILDRTGTLKRVATQLNFWDISRNGAVISRMPAKAWYGTIHQAGIGGFSKNLQAAEKNLGAGTRGREVVKEAFDIMDESGGDKRGTAAIPARPFVMFQEEDEYNIAEVFFDWLNNRVEVYWGVG
jgi:phage gpG-like protein